MARPLRIEYPGALYHVISRGNERRPIVRDDRDRQRRLEWLQRTVQTYAWRLHAFMLMTNHEHLFVETPEANLSAGMQYLNGSYTSYFNRRHRRAGHLFQGRFRGQLIEAQGYFLEVSRYLHLNPVRARPSVDEIAELVAGHFGRAQEDWSEGRRSDDASRAVAAYLARRRYGHPATLVAAALGYRDPSSVSHALRRIDDVPASLRRLVEELEKKLG